MRIGRIDSRGHVIVTDGHGELGRMRVVQFLAMPAIDVLDISFPAFFVPVVLKAGPAIHMFEVVFGTCWYMSIVLETVSDKSAISWAV